jgi:hypothetical protein
LINSQITQISFPSIFKGNFVTYLNESIIWIIKQEILWSKDFFSFE